jgi:amino acid adenylation domain-containing protein
MIKARAMFGSAFALKAHFFTPCGVPHRIHPLNKNPGSIRGRFLERPMTDLDFARDEVERSICERFEVVAANHAGQVAVIDGDIRMTYADVKATAARVRAALSRVSNRSLANVGVLFGVEAAVVPAIYGVLYSGCAYVPLDPSLPEARLKMLIDTTKCGVILTNGRLRKLVESAGVPILDIEQLPDSAPSDSDYPAAAASTAYVIYTSGSTGRPKGVIQTHRNILADSFRQGRDLRTDSDDRYGLLFSAASSAAGCSIFGALLNGAALSCYDIAKHGIGRMAEWLANDCISICDISVATLRLFAGSLAGNEQFPRMRLIAPGGEPVTRHDVELCRRIFPTTCVVQNSLGTTETRTATQYFIDASMPLADPIVPVGFAVDSKEVLLLSESGIESEEGEIVIRSRYLSPGYFDEPELTSAVFCEADKGTGERLYRTGDLGRRLPDGCLIHLGRRDFQVKINGYRVETAEVEDALLRIDHVDDAAVAAQPGPEGVLHLVAYITAKAEIDLDYALLRQACAKELPRYAVPKIFHRLNVMPKTPNGKLDRRALVASESGEMLPAADSVVPRDEIEQKLMRIWCTKLGRDSVGVDEGFFASGGDSLSALACLMEIESNFGCRISPSVFTHTASVASLANEIRRARSRRETPGMVLLKPGSSSAPLFLVHSIAGTFLHYRHFLENGRFDGPVYGIECQLGKPDTELPKDMETLAKAYVAVLREFSPMGPYALAGHSFGGLVAYEMARQLRVAGEEVSFLGLLDTDLREYVDLPMRFGDALGKFASNLRSRIFEQRNVFPWQIARRQIAKLAHWYRSQGQSKANRDFGLRIFPEELRAVAQIHIDLAARYRPAPIAGCTCLFASRRRSILKPIPIEDAWRMVLPEGLECYDVPGDHSSTIENGKDAAQTAAIFCGVLSAKRNAPVIRRGRFVPRSSDQ